MGSRQKAQKEFLTTNYTNYTNGRQKNVLGSGEPLTAVGITEFYLENEFSK